MCYHRTLGIFPSYVETNHGHITRVGLERETFAILEQCHYEQCYSVSSMVDIKQGTHVELRSCEQHFREDDRS